MNTNEPYWDQSFTFSPIRHSELKSRTLDISLWDYDRYCANEFLGQVVIELANVPLDNEPQWYLLASNEETLAHLVSSFDRSVCT